VIQKPDSDESVSSRIRQSLDLGFVRPQGRPGVSFPQGSGSDGCVPTGGAGHKRTHERDDGKSPLQGVARGPVESHPPPAHVRVPRGTTGTGADDRTPGDRCACGSRLAVTGTVGNGHIGLPGRRNRHGLRNGNAGIQRARTPRAAAPPAGKDFREGQVVRLRFGSANGCFKAFGFRRLCPANNLPPLRGLAPAMQRFAQATP